MTLTLHEHPFASYCWKALIALGELGLPFEPRLVEDDDDR
ncbi:MAG: Glutathione S-transferase, N-terminal domain, partial [Gaiellaceae bacterium]|nr:Glutathione S-transferase, N-terminal domain [Gaiellaceae bacterium]